MTVCLGANPDYSPTDLAYLAGLIDGEGYVGAKRRMPSEANRMKPRSGTGAKFRGSAA